MNSYPPELLAQLAPVMFVAGLEPDTQSRLQDVTSQLPREFELLVQRLRDALQAQRTVAIWQPEKLKTFQVVLVSKEVGFPPRKSTTDESKLTVAHSPLSPLTPSSPLYPDGVIAPIWVRKHTTLVPSVFVLFLRIYEHPSQHTLRSPPDLPNADIEHHREQEERKQDTALAAEIAQRKKLTNERNIKLTVVLMASRKLLDDPALDTRLTYIRRQSGLDSRAALFVLSPVSPEELNEFVKSLQQALYEPALDYYTAHSKRVRRKRNRHSQVTPYSVVASGHSPTIARPLRPEGWTVRYEYKMACFAEFRGEDEVALKHYQDAYSMLLNMFGSTALLPPRTKRWAEAKVLADCVNVKILKLYLYNNEHSLALSHHHAHLRRFTEFSRAWGIGEETFEFWSWTARQHRVLAELLEHGLRSNLVLPVHKPSSHNSIALVNTSGNLRSIAAEMEYLMSVGLNPSHALQHPGFYYYMAARCTYLRREKFLVVLEAEASDQPIISSPGFANEKKVDHFTIILELYTKAYELFKSYYSNNQSMQSQGRLTLWIAFHIAKTYSKAGKYGMAIRFFERIAKSYRREKWGSMLRPLLSHWFACAQKLGDVESSVRLLVELLGHEVPDWEEPETIEQDLMAVLKSAVPSSDEALIVDLQDTQPILRTDVVFWTTEAKVGEMVAFQISFTAPSRPTMSSLPFTSLAIHFSHRDVPIFIRHYASSHSPVQCLDLGHITSSEIRDELSMDLRWEPGSSIIFYGTVSSQTPLMAKVSTLVLTIAEGSWKVDVSFNPSEHHSLSTSTWWRSFNPPKRIPFQRENPSLIRFVARPHRLIATTDFEGPAYLDEEFAITITIVNDDDEDLDVVVDVLLQPTDTGDSHQVNTIILEGESSSGYIKGVSFGSLSPGVTAVKTLYLLGSGSPGDRVLDMSIQSRAKEPPQGVDAVPDSAEILRTIVIPTVAPIVISQDVVYRRSLDDRPGLADLRTYEHNSWGDGSGYDAIISTVMHFAGPSTLEVRSIKLERNAGVGTTVLESSVDDDNDYPLECSPGDEVTCICRVGLASTELYGFDEQVIPSAGRYIVTWKRYSEKGQGKQASTSVLSLPGMHPPVEGLIALLDVPTVATLHQPVTMELTIRNRHPFRTANIVVQLESDSSDTFVVSGLRSGHVPILLPGADEKLKWQLIPMECGHVSIPRIKVTNRRMAASGDTSANLELNGNGEPVNVIDLRVERTVPGSSKVNEMGTILVLPN